MSRFRRRRKSLSRSQLDLIYQYCGKYRGMSADEVFRAAFRDSRLGVSLESTGQLWPSPQSSPTI